MNNLNKHLISVLLLSVAAFFSGIFTVNENEVGIETDNSNVVKIYQTGTHWKIPFYHDITMVYTSERNMNVEDSIKVIDHNKEFLANLAFNWHVVDPIKYVAFVQQNDKIANVLTSMLLPNYANANNSVELYSLLSNKVNNSSFESVGISVDKVYITNLTSSNVMAQNQESSIDISTADYTQAMQIKQQVNSEFSTAQQKMQQANPKFYKLYTYIESMQISNKNGTESLGAISNKFN